MKRCNKHPQMYRYTRNVNNPSYVMGRYPPLFRCYTFRPCTRWSTYHTRTKQGFNQYCYHARVAYIYIYIYISRNRKRKLKTCEEKVICGARASSPGPLKLPSPKRAPCTVGSTAIQGKHQARKSPPLYDSAATQGKHQACPNPLLYDKSRDLSIQPSFFLTRVVNVSSSREP